MYGLGAVHINRTQNAHRIFHQSLAHLPDTAFTTLHTEPVVGLGGEDQIGDGKFSVGVEDFDAALVDEDKHPAHLAMCGGSGHCGEGIAEVGLPASHAIYGEGSARWRRNASPRARPCRWRGSMVVLRRRALTSTMQAASRPVAFLENARMTSGDGFTLT